MENPMKMIRNGRFMGTPISGHLHMHAMYNEINILQTRSDAMDCTNHLGASPLDLSWRGAEADDR